MDARVLGVAVCVAALGGMTAAAAGSESVFRYDATRGVCVDAGGKIGLNALDPERLFKPDGTETVEGFPHTVYLDKDAECVDFSGFDFNAKIGLRWPWLERWNLRGARLDGARLHFAGLYDADLSGAHFAGLEIGYTEITGKVDAYSEVTAGCTRDGNRVSCRR